MYDNELRKRICELCKDSRLREHMSAAEAAKMIGLSRQAVTKFENGYNFSGKIFCWYLTHTFNGHDIRRLVSIVKEYDNGKS